MSQELKTVQGDISPEAAKKLNFIKGVRDYKNNGQALEDAIDLLHADLVNELKSMEC